MSDTQPLAFPTDYYSLLGLTPHHLFPGPERVSVQRSGARRGWSLSDLWDNKSDEYALDHPDEPVSPAMVDMAAVQRLRELRDRAGLSPEQRALQELELELGRRILGDAPRRARYDALLTMLRTGRIQERLEQLRLLQEEVRFELACERREEIAITMAERLLVTCEAMLARRERHSAITLLRQIVRVLPGSEYAQLTFARALLQGEDPLLLGAHALREALQALEVAASQGAAVSAQLDLCRGLLARDDGDLRSAERYLTRAATSDPRLGPAWRGLAALALAGGRPQEALAACRDALAADPRDERALLMAGAAALRLGRPDHARDAARRVAGLRGGDWTEARVMREITG